MIVNIAHSPDSDDFYMFWAIREKRLGIDGVKFNFTALNTEDLNLAALQGSFDLIAISAAVYPRIREDYLILPYGASVGRNYGPKVVSKKEFSFTELNNKRIAIPGETTTACLLLKQIAPKAKLITYPISPYEVVFSALERGEVDAALLIHEGQLSYHNRGLTMIVDIGQWWHKHTKLPLPLGLNVIAKRLGDAQIAKLSQLVAASLREALNHQEEVISYLLELNKNRGVDLSTPSDITNHSANDCSLRNYLNMYANNDSMFLSTDTKAGLEQLLRPLYHGDVIIEYA